MFMSFSKTCQLVDNTVSLQDDKNITNDHKLLVIENIVFIFNNCIRHKQVAGYQHLKIKIKNPQLEYLFISPLSSVLQGYLYSLILCTFGTPTYDIIFQTYIFEYQLFNSHQLQWVQWDKTLATKVSSWRDVALGWLNPVAGTQHFVWLLIPCKKDLSACMYHLQVTEERLQHWPHHRTQSYRVVFSKKIKKKK